MRRPIEVFSLRKTVKDFPVHTLSFLACSSCLVGEERGETDGEREKYRAVPHEAAMASEALGGVGDDSEGGFCSKFECINHNASSIKQKEYLVQEQMPY